ncbi:palmitoyl protein thioesterase [Ophiocordyceps camponoti-floridani]|uniref:Palmitoyl-protein thioesterase 1 n=1 Tax=Ophiocordyceps camponoti-floridani TaxID=2030778 RepID=A0A8H4Q2Y9_9HYPO|nr:palmitoyl protein thioesterase [Ophiocordyceps camponoti-floridani]
MAPRPPLLLVALFTLSTCTPSSPPQPTIIPLSPAAKNPQPYTSSSTNPLPLLIWHGLGDTFSSPGIEEIASLASTIHPGTLVYTISLGGSDARADRSATFFGNVSAQLSDVCDAVAAHPILATAPSVDALGLSQGGQFMRGFVERCNVPPVRSLVTFGSQHNGIAQFKQCEPTDWLCGAAMLLLKHNTWSHLVQSRLVPAQYYRDPADYDSYLDNSNFLADINNERPVKNETYRANLARLANFVLYMFDHDETVIPKETSWFAEVNGSNVVPLRERRIYTEDWLGLRRLDEKGALHFRTIAGGHMDIPRQLLNHTMAEFFGPLRDTIFSDEL